MLKIAIIDDNKESIMITSRLLGSDYSVMSYTSGEEAIRVMSVVKPDIILLDIEMPGMDGFATYMGLRDAGIEAPVIGLTGDRKKETVLKFISLGACGYVAKPPTKAALKDAIEQASKKLKDRTNFNLLIIDDEPESLALSKTVLSKDYNVMGLNNPKTAIAYLQKHKPDLIVMDYNMPIYSGKFMLKYMSDRPELAAVPTVIYTGDESGYIDKECKDLGAAAVARKQAGIGNLKKIIDTLLLDKLMEELSYHD